jgi:beta-glucosidase
LATKPVNAPPETPSRRTWLRERRFRAFFAIAAAVVFAVVIVLVARNQAPSRQIGEVNSAPTGGTGTGQHAAIGTAADTDYRCPWLDAAMDQNQPAAALAGLVLKRMTLAEKLDELVLVTSGVYENTDSGVARLCIPPLTLQDGPQGVAFEARHVTQLPAPLGIAATFDPTIAKAYGEVEGSEAGGQGIDVVQGPNLNIDRVPENGRSYEGYGEDPVLVSAMGVANIEGIQSTGTMAMAKHFAVYNQETDRGELNDAVSERSLEELYLPPFRAAVTEGRVASVMCAYPQLNGTFQCQDGLLLGLLGPWGFTGFVRSDLGSVHDPVAALTAGTDLIKPANAHQLAALVREKLLSVSVVDAAVTRVLTLMFSYGLIGRTETGAAGTPVDSPAHTAFALQAAERSAVLLKDNGSVLPLSTAPGRSVAVIGADAESAPVTTGFGSSRVVPPFTSTPLAAIRRRAGAGATVTYSNGGSTTAGLPAIPTEVLAPASGAGHGLTLTLTQIGGQLGTPAIQMVVPTVDAAISPHASTNRLLPGPSPPSSVNRLHNPPSIGRRSFSLPRPSSPNRSRIELPAGWSDASATWTGTLTPPRSGLYTLSLQGSGAATLSLDGKTAVADTLSHARGRWSQTVPLTAGHPYQLRLDWEPLDNLTPSGESSLPPGTLTLGWQYVSDQITAAAEAARKASVAVVFAGDFNSEAFDRPSLSLPGDEDALISAVAAANPRTVVVLNTGGPVLMPWLGSVAGVLEAWYPGEADGAAIAALLFGDVDPSGRLPVTFPTSEAQSAINTTAQWPGMDLTSTYSEGLEVGYRYDHANDIQPLFPFGFGMAYTNFTLGHLTVSRSPRGVSLTVEVTNRGSRSGTDVPQAYLTYPAAAGEPPAQLVAFQSVTLEPGSSRVITLSVPASAFQAFLGEAWTTVPGSYTLSVGESSANLPVSASLTMP